MEKLSVLSNKLYESFNSFKFDANALIEFAQILKEKKENYEKQSNFLFLLLKSDASN